MTEKQLEIARTALLKLKSLPDLTKDENEALDFFLRHAAIEKLKGALK